MRAVFFDVDDTLVDYDHAARTMFSELLGADASYDEFRAHGHYERYLEGALAFREMREQRMADYLVLLGHEGDAADLERRRLDGMSRHYRLFPDVLTCLDELRARGLRLGLITNNDGEHQRDKLATVALDGLFDAVVISGEVGVAKPDARIFEHACAQLGVAPSEAMHVGDNRSADVEGSVAAGLRGVWLDRARCHDGAAVDYVVIASLAEVPALVA